MTFPSLLDVFPSPRFVLQSPFLISSWIFKSTLNLWKTLTKMTKQIYNVVLLGLLHPILSFLKIIGIQSPYTLNNWRLLTATSSTKFISINLFITTPSDAYSTLCLCHFISPFLFAVLLLCVYFFRSITCCTFFHSWFSCTYSCIK